EAALRAGENDVDGNKIARSAQAFLVPLAVLMALFFYVLWQIYGDNVLLFQPIMYAMPLSLFGPIAASMCAPRNIATWSGRWAVFVGIAGAILSVIVLYIVSSLPGQTDIGKNWAPALMPVVSIGWGAVAGLVAVFGLKQNKATIEPAVFR